MNQLMKFFCVSIFALHFAACGRETAAPKAFADDVAPHSANETQEEKNQNEPAAAAVAASPPATGNQFGPATMAELNSAKLRPLEFSLKGFTGNCTYYSYGMGELQGIRIGQWSEEVTAMALCHALRELQFKVEQSGQGTIDPEQIKNDVQLYEVVDGPLVDATDADLGRISKLVTYRIEHDAAGTVEEGRILLAGPVAYARVVEVQVTVTFNSPESLGASTLEAVLEGYGPLVLASGGGPGGRYVNLQNVSGGKSDDVAAQADCLNGYSRRCSAVLVADYALFEGLEKVASLVLTTRGPVLSEPLTVLSKYPATNEIPLDEKYDQVLECYRIYERIEQVNYKPFNAKAPNLANRVVSEDTSRSISQLKGQLFNILLSIRGHENQSAMAKKPIISNDSAAIVHAGLSKCDRMFGYTFAEDVPLAKLE